MKPTRTYDLFDGVVAVKGFGVTRSAHNWSLAKLKADQMVEVDPCHRTAKEIAWHTKGMSVLAPYPTKCNGLVCKSEDQRFDQVSNLLWKTLFLRGPEADGVILPVSNLAFAISSADCPTVVISYKDHAGKQTILACHAGRNSVIDMVSFKSGMSPRKNYGVVFEAMAKVPEHEKKNVRVWIGLSISPGEWFEHKKKDGNNPHNWKMVTSIIREYGESCFAEDGLSYTRGHLHLSALIREQLVKAGVKRENITYDDVCTYGDVSADGNHLWYSQIRTPGMRNLVLVIRKK